MASNVDIEYENTISLYLKNDYYIVSQTENTTIMLSKKFQKDADKTAGVLGALGNAEIGSFSYQSANANKEKYQVVIRITKMGTVDVSGFTLEKQATGKTANKEHMKKTWKSSLKGGLIVGSAMILFFIVLWFLFYIGVL